MSTAQIQLAALAPMLCVAIGSLVVLLAEVWLTKRGVAEARIGSTLAMLSGVALALSLSAAVAAFASGGPLVFNLTHPMLRLDAFSAFAIGVIALASLLVCALSVTYLAELQINHGEYYALILLSAAGMMFLVAATDLMMLFIGLELMSIPIYVLAGFDRRKLDSNESALKYFLVGSFASALLLYGAALVYGTTGGLQYSVIREGFSPENALAMTGLGLLIVGFAFKVSAVPFHQWTPDVYQGAPTSVTAYMAVTVKVAAFMALLRLLLEAFGPLSGELTGLFWALAALTVVVGNVMAVIQDNLKRLLAYSSIAHAGYLLIGFVAGGEAGYTALLFYLLIYVFMNLGAFAVIVALANRGRDCEEIDDLAGLASTRPALAALLTLFVLSLAGIPGTAGFMGKFLVFSAAVQEGHVSLAIIGVLASVVSVYYYLRIPVAMYMREASDVSLRQTSSTLEIVVLGICAAAVLYFGLFPNGGLGLELTVLDWARVAADLRF